MYHTMVMCSVARDPKRIEVVGLGRLFALAYPLLQEIRPIAGHDEHELGHEREPLLHVENHQYE